MSGYDKEWEGFSFDITVETYDKKGELVDTRKLEDMEGAYILSVEKPAPEGVLAHGIMMGKLELKETARLIINTFRENDKEGYGMRCLLLAVLEMIQKDIELMMMDVPIAGNMRVNLVELIKQYEESIGTD